MKKALIISYYWPPSGGAGVQRWLKFVKYLREFGWEPVIYTPSNPEYPEADLSLARDIPAGIQILQQPIWEPYQLYKMLTGRKADEKVQAGFIQENKKPGLREKISAWIRGNLFIPDARRYWIKPSVKYLDGWLSQNPVDVIISTGPPHSMHLIAMPLAAKHHIPWLADFRDPWTQIDFYHHLRLSPWADRWHRQLESQVLQRANLVTTVSKHCAIGLTEISGRAVQVITNGYDSDDFYELPDFDYSAFRITHLGSMNADRNPKVLWEVLAELVQEEAFFAQNLQLQFIGKTDHSVFESLENHALSPYMVNQKYLPHDQAIQQASNSALLLLALNNTPHALGISPGKLYEYMALKRPILGIGPEAGDAAYILHQTQTGQCFDFEAKKPLKTWLRQQAKAYQEHGLQVQPNASVQYSRKYLTEELAQLLNKL